MIVEMYRVMCKEEYEKVSNTNPFSFNSKFKWFTENFDFIKSRVTDGKFNNSKFKPERYTHLVKYVVDTKDKDYILRKVSNSELMLSIKHVPLLKVLRVEKLGEYHAN